MPAKGPWEGLSGQVPASMPVAQPDHLPHQHQPAGLVRAALLGVPQIRFRSQVLRLVQHPLMDQVLGPHATNPETPEQP